MTIDDKKPVLLYILAPSYSGSTLLTLLLAQHSKIATVGEMIFDHKKRDVDTYSCSCGQLLKECPFWAKVSAICASNGISFSVDNFDTTFGSENRLTNRILKATYKNKWFSMARAILIKAIPGAAATLREKVRRIFDIGQAIRVAQNGRVFLDASKHPVRLHYFMQSGLWNIKVVYLTRDGRGVTCSNMSNQGLEFKQAYKQWRRAAGELERCWSALPPNTGIQVQYEDLCRDPGGVVSKILTRLDIGEADGIGEQIRQKDHHILGNRMRLKFKSEIKLDERWRSELSDEELAEFDRRCGRLNRMLGYD